MISLMLSGDNRPNGGSCCCDYSPGSSSCPGFLASNCGVKISAGLTVSDKNYVGPSRHYHAMQVRDGLKESHILQCVTSLCWWCYACWQSQRNMCRRESGSFLGAMFCYLHVYRLSPYMPYSWMVVVELGVVYHSTSSYAIPSLP